MEGKPSNLKELIKQGYVFPAWLPDKNDFLLNSAGKDYRAKIIANSAEPNTDISFLDLDKLDQIKGYFGFLTQKDYGAMSPMMWNTLLERRGIDNLKTLFFVADPANAEIVVQGLKQDPKYLGGGFGSGWKEHGNFLDRRDPEDLIAVNNIGRDKATRELIGYNTDVEGLLRPLEVKFNEIGNPSLEGKTILMFGAGGVGKQLTRALVKRGVEKIYVVNRTVPKAEDMANDANAIKPGIAEFSGEPGVENYFANRKIDVVLNSSKKGAEPLDDFSAFAPIEGRDEQARIKNNQQSLYLSKKLLAANPNAIIYDITLPRRDISKTLEIAKQAGLQNLIGGKGMVINQGIIAIKNVEKTNPGVFGKVLDEKEIERVFSEVALWLMRNTLEMTSGKENLMKH